MMLGGCAPGWFPAWIVLTLWDKFLGPELDSSEDDLLRSSKDSRENEYVIYLSRINFPLFLFSFEFLAGNLEEDYPQTARANGSATKYQI
jgi:hypothetical protein